jgi:hypothetical protein
LILFYKYSYKIGSNEIHYENENRSLRIKKENINVKESEITDYYDGLVILRTNEEPCKLNLQQIMNDLFNNIFIQSTRQTFDFALMIQYLNMTLKCIQEVFSQFYQNNELFMVSFLDILEDFKVKIDLHLLGINAIKDLSFI